MNLPISLRSEIVKTRRTAAFYFTLVGAGVIPLIFLLNVFTDGLPDENKSVKDPLNAIFKLSSEMNGFAILPLFVVLVCTLLPQIEYKNNTWKQLLTSPQTRANVFMAKFLNVHSLILLFLLASHSFMWLVAIVAHFVLPELNILSRPLDLYSVLLNNVNSYISILAICTMQFWMGMRIKNFFVPIAVGLALWFTGTLLVMEYGASYARYFPYSFQIFGSLPQYKAQFNDVRWTSLGYAAFFLVLGFLDFRRRRRYA